MGSRFAVVKLNGKFTHPQTEQTTLAPVAEASPEEFEAILAKWKKQEGSADGCR